MQGIAVHVDRGSAATRLDGDSNYTGRVRARESATSHGPPGITRVIPRRPPPDNTVIPGGSTGREKDPVITEVIPASSYVTVMHNAIIYSSTWHACPSLTEQFHDDAAASAHFTYTAELALVHLYLYTHICTQSTYA